MCSSLGVLNYRHFYFLPVPFSIFQILFFYCATRHTGWIEPVPPAVEAQSLNHWTTREVPQILNDAGTHKKFLNTLFFLPKKASYPFFFK